MGKYFFILFFLLHCYRGFAGDEVPKVYHFEEQTYQALSQNWDISQANDYQMFFGNSGGLLSYDGSRWCTRPTPFNQIVRAVHADAEGRVFVGGFATMGYWHVNVQHEEEYVSLLGLMDDRQVAEEEIWHILPLENELLFQSFSKIYKYDFQKIEVITPPGNIMFSRRVGNQVIVPVIDQGLFEYGPEGAFHFIEGSEIFAQSQIATILPADSGWLVCSQNGDLYRYQNGRFSKWAISLSQRLQALQLNKSLRLSNGNYAFGTILGGIFITDADGRVIHHVNQENGLQNNTVLALFEDKMNMLWVGLDRGIDLVDLNSPLLFFQDHSGRIGTVYAAAQYQGQLYVGTNQGVFHKPFPGQGQPFKLLEGSQGQVWELKEVNGQLLGGHNAGAFRIDDGRMVFFNTGTGAYGFVKHPQQDDVMLQGSYVGINVFRKNGGGEWQFSHRLGEYPLSVEKMAFDASGKLWALHPRRGLARLTLNEDVTQVSDIENLGIAQGLPSLYGLDLDKVGSDIFVKTSDGLLRWNLASALFEPAPAQGEYLLLDGGSGDSFRVFPEKIVWAHEGTESSMKITLQPGEERIIPLSAAWYLLCVEGGYALLPRQRPPAGPGEKPPPTPLIVEVVANENEKGRRSRWPGQDTIVFRATERHLRFYFSQPVYAGAPRLQSKLEGFDADWTPLSRSFSREFTNLRHGEYRFLVRSENSPQLAVFVFFIEPKWYQTDWAMTLTVALVAGLFLFFYRLHRIRLKRHIAKLQIEKERELNIQQTEAANRLLQTEVLNKSRKLADTTMNLVRKNEMLTKLKEELDQATRQKEGDPTKKALTKMEHLIEAHLTDEADWQIFESNFNQLHDQFFKRLKEQYPDLTPGDLRLAAYLKMNLASKEIAPLLNISVRGVENKRYRLRHKMGLDGEVNLTEYLMGY